MWRGATLALTVLAKLARVGALVRGLTLLGLTVPGLTVPGVAVPGVALLGLTVVGLTATRGQAQQLGLPQSAVLTLASDRLFSESAFGQRVAREVEAESAVLAAENRRIEAELTAEEKELTARRQEMEPEAFRALADAFDIKVQATRSTQDAKARALNQIGESARGEFLLAARPILEALMRETGAGVILKRSNVFLSANAIDITDLAIERIDAAIGDGSALSGTPEQ